MMKAAIITQFILVYFSPPHSPHLLTMWYEVLWDNFNTWFNNFCVNDIDIAVESFSLKNEYIKLFKQVFSFSPSKVVTSLWREVLCVFFCRRQKISIKKNFLSGVEFEVIILLIFLYFIKNLAHSCLAASLIFHFLTQSWKWKWKSRI